MECRPQPLWDCQGRGLLLTCCAWWAQCSGAQGAGDSSTGLPLGDFTHMDSPSWFSVNLFKHRNKIINVNVSSLAPLHIFKKNHSLSALIMEPQRPRKGKGVPPGHWEVPSQSWAWLAMPPSHVRLFLVLDNTFLFKKKKKVRTALLVPPPKASVLSIHPIPS